MKTCTNCNNSIVDDAKFCLHCGTNQEKEAIEDKTESQKTASSEQPKQDIKQDNPAARAQESTTACENCGRTLMKNQFFCGSCGHTNPNNPDAIIQAERHKELENERQRYKQDSTAISVSCALQLVFLIIMLIPVVAIAFTQDISLKGFFSYQIYKLSDFILNLGGGGSSLTQKTIAGIIVVLLSSLAIISWVLVFVSLVLILRSKTTSKLPAFPLLKLFTFIALCCCTFIALLTFVYMTYSFMLAIMVLLYANIALSKADFIAHVSTRKDREKNLQVYTMLFSSMLFALLFAEIIRIRYSPASLLSLVTNSSIEGYTFFLKACPIIIMFLIIIQFILSILNYVFSIKVNNIIHIILFSIIFTLFIFVGTGSYVSYLENNYFYLNFWFYFMMVTNFFALMLTPITKALDYAKQKKPT